MPPCAHEVLVSSSADFDRTSTSTPSRAACSAVAAPATPPPTTSTSVRSSGVLRRASAPSRAGKRGVAWVRSKGSWLRRRWAAAGQFAGAAASGAFTAGAAVSLPRIQIRMGAAMYTVEYTPEIMPMIIAKENASRSEPEP